jgi:glycosyltransferase involved in cell wall biosynthesis
MRLGVVVPCFRQERFLPRTLAALEQALAGTAWQGVVVVSGGASDAVPGAGPAWRVLCPPAGVAPTPGGARMLGCAAVEGEAVLFVDADTEVDGAWVARALACAAGPSRVAGWGGRLEERVTDGARDWPGVSDLNRTGDAERDVELLTTPALYRRDALLAVGGYDPRLSAEEDFELALRLAAAGWTLRVLPGPAGRHWNAPRPSVAELRRRWAHGLVFGPGQALRLYLGRRGFARLLWRQRVMLATLVFWTAGATAALAAALGAGPVALRAWAFVLLAGLAVLAVRKRSLRLAVHALLAWTVNGLGVLIGFVRGPARPAARGA